MMFKLKKIAFLSSVLFFCINSLSIAQKIELSNYKNKAQAYAILSAQYSNDAYYYSRQNYFLNSTSTIKQNCDSGIVFIQIAINYADSALMVANDSCVLAKNKLLNAKSSQELAIKKFQQIIITSDNFTIHKLSGEAMFAVGNAIADAYRASLELEFEGLDLTDKIVENKRDVTRLESDEFSFITIKELYGKRLVEIENELVLLEAENNKSTGKQKLDISNVIAPLKAEQKELLSKSKNSEDKLIKIKNDLSKEMLQIVNKDFFTTEKTGFYNENVPIPNISEIPKGLVYKIQIGFFKNQLPAKHFDGVFPISSQKIDGNYYKYTAGNFKKYNDAKEAKTLLRSKGYKDAFVISFIDGVKVPIIDALKREEEEKK